MQIDNHLYQEIKDYCILNNLKTRDFIHNLLKEAFLKEKYGDTPFIFNNKKETSIEIKKEEKEIKNIEVLTEKNEIIENITENIIKNEDFSIKEPIIETKIIEEIEELKPQNKIKTKRKLK